MNFCFKSTFKEAVDMIITLSIIIAISKSFNSHEHRHHGVGHEENLGEGNEPQNVALLELHERNQQTRTPPTVLAQHLREKKRENKC